MKYNYIYFVKKNNKAKMWRIGKLLKPIETKCIDKVGFIKIIAREDNGPIADMERYNFPFFRITIFDCKFYTTLNELISEHFTKLL